MNYISNNELCRLESKGLIEDLSILSNGEVYCRITSSNVTVLSRLANRSDDFEYHESDYRIHEAARPIKCYYVQFKLPVNAGDINVNWEDISLDYEPQFPECPERYYVYPEGIHSQICLVPKVIHLGIHEAFKSDGCGTAKAPLLPMGAFMHESPSIPFHRDAPIVAGDRREIWDTQTRNGFGVDDFVIPYSVNYVPCPKYGRVPVESLSISERVNRLFKCMHDTRGDYIKTIKVFSVIRFPGKEPRVRVKYERKLRCSINIYDRNEILPNMHRGGNRVKLAHPIIPDCAARTPSVSEEARVHWVERMSNLMVP